MNGRIIHHDVRLTSEEVEVLAVHHRNRKIERARSEEYEWANYHKHKSDEYFNILEKPRQYRQAAE